MKKKPILLLLISIIFLTLTGCDSLDTSTSVPKVIDGVGYSITGEVTDNVINGAPDRLSNNAIHKAGVSFGDLICILGYYNDDDQFVQFEGIKSFVTLKGEFFFKSIDLQDNFLSNIVIRVLFGDQVLYEDIIPWVKPGHNRVSTITPESRKRALMVRTAKKMKMKDFDIGKILSRIPPSDMVELCDEDVKILTRVFVNISLKEKQIFEDMGIPVEKYEAMQEYGRELSATIIEGIESGEYRRDDQGWRLYNYYLKKWAYENLFDENSVSLAPRRATSITTSDINNVDLLFLAINNEYVKVSQDAADGQLTIVNFSTGVEQTVTITDPATVSSVLSALVMDMNIYGKVDFVVNQIIRLKNNINNANTYFSTNLSMDTINGSTDSLAVDYQAMELTDSTQAEAYLDYATTDVKRDINIILGEFLWAIAGYDHPTLLMYLYSMVEFKTFMDAQSPGLLDPASPLYSAAAAKVNSYSNNLDMFLDLSDILYNYISGSDEDIMIIITNIQDFLIDLDELSLVFVSNFTSTYGINWNTSQQSVVASLFVNIYSLNIEQPMPTIAYNGQTFDQLSGMLKVLSKTLRIDGQKYYSEVVNSFTGSRVAYVRNWTETDESYMLDQLQTNPLYTVINNVYYGSNDNNLVPTTVADFVANVANTNLWEISLYSNSISGYAIATPAITIESLTYNNSYDFRGFLMPPSGTWNTDGSINDISKFDTEPMLFVLGSATELNVGEIPYFGEQVDEIGCKLTFDTSRNSFLVTHTAFVEGGTLLPLCPKQDPNSTWPEPEYWELDFTASTIKDLDAGTEEPFDPNVYGYLDKNFLIWGRLVERTINGSEIVKTLDCYYVVDLTASPPTPSGFVLTGIVHSVEVNGGSLIIDIYDPNNIGVFTMRITGKKQYSDINTWFSDRINRNVTIGDPDELDDTDGITVPVTTAVWDESLNGYTLNLDYNMSLVDSSGKPYWARENF